MRDNRAKFRCPGGDLRRERQARTMRVDRSIKKGTAVVELQRFAAPWGWHP